MLKQITFMDTESCICIMILYDKTQNKNKSNLVEGEIEESSVVFIRQVAAAICYGMFRLGA